eukprot:gene10407-biopygen7584
MDPETPAADEPKFVAFYSMLATLFQMFCFNCKSSGPRMEMKSIGTSVSVTQTCDTCGRQFNWNSQPLLFGKTPAGNLMMSFGILMSGANETSSSNAMEFLGAQRCFQFLYDAQVKIIAFISDRHKSIAKWIREKHPDTVHYHEKFLQRKRTSVELYPSEKRQEELPAVASSVVNVTSGSKTKRAAPTCKACKKPRKRHPEGPSPFV